MRYLPVAWSFAVLSFACSSNDTSSEAISDAGGNAPGVSDAIASSDSSPAGGDAGGAKGPSDYPNADNTGPTTSRCGALTEMKAADVHDDNTVIENKRILGTFQVYAKNVIIRCSEIVGAWDVGPIVYGRDDGLTIEDCSIHAPSNHEKAQYSIAMTGNNLTVRRTNMYWWSDAIQVGGTDILIEDNYIHDAVYYAGDHTDGFQHYGSGKRVTIQHNTVENPIDQTSCIALFQDSGEGYDDVLVDDNWLAGGGYSIYGGGGAGQAPSSNVRFTNNKFSTKFFPKSGHYGPVAYWPPASGTGNVWSNNVWYDGPDKGKAIDP